MRALSAYPDGEVTAGKGATVRNVSVPFTHSMRLGSDPSATASTLTARAARDRRRSRRRDIVCPSRKPDFQARSVLCLQQGETTRNDFRTRLIQFSPESHCSQHEFMLRSRCAFLRSPAPAAKPFDATSAKNPSHTCMFAHTSIITFSITANPKVQDRPLRPACKPWIGWCFAPRLLTGGFSNR